MFFVQMAWQKTPNRSGVELKKFWLPGYSCFFCQHIMGNPPNATPPQEIRPKGLLTIGFPLLIRPY